MSLDERQTMARKILASLMDEEATPASGEWVWGLVAAALGCGAVWLIRFW